jgi:hypothetical protein
MALRSAIVVKSPSLAVAPTTATRLLNRHRLNRSAPARWPGGGIASAARRYLDELAARSLTEQVNDALQVVGDDDSAAAAVQAGHARLAAGEEW